nr:hypothetical protein Q903MT_gene2170 [Picea sitchensis]
MARSVGMAIVRMARLVLGFVEEAFCQGLRLRRKEGNNFLRWSRAKMPSSEGGR